MQFISIDSQGIYRGMVDGTPGDVPGSFYSPSGVRTSQLGPPPTDEPGKWRDDGVAWTEITEEDIRVTRVAEIHAELDDIDRQSVRPLRAIIKGVGTDEDTNRLATLEQEAEDLRVELAGLTPEPETTDPEDETEPQAEPEEEVAA
jgi:hypothetical protein